MAVHIPYHVIKSATNNFNIARLLGNGQFGRVYKGHLEPGVINDKRTTVAIKRLNRKSEHREHDFKTELANLSRVQHRNIVSLLGYCNQVENHFRELILVFELMEGGTVGEHLYRRNSLAKLDTELPPPLSWMQRLNIGIGAAQGLNHLHTGIDTNSRIIHRDVKSSNILLDKNLEPKVSDFGLSKLTAPGKSDYVSTHHAKGELGYLDPVYMATKTLTTKSDVYSFGVVLLELLCGEAAVDRSFPIGEQRLTRRAKLNIEKDTKDAEKAIREITDPSVVDEINWYSLKVYVELVNQCLLENDRHKRPTMVEVASRLETAMMCQVDLNGPVENCIDPSLYDEMIFLTHCAPYYDNQEGSSDEEEKEEEEEVEEEEEKEFSGDESKGEGGKKQETSWEYYKAELEAKVDYGEIESTREKENINEAIHIPDQQFGNEDNKRKA